MKVNLSRKLFQLLALGIGSHSIESGSQLLTVSLVYHYIHLGLNHADSKFDLISVLNECVKYFSLAVHTSSKVKAMNYLSIQLLSFEKTHECSSVPS